MSEDAEQSDPNLPGNPPDRHSSTIPILGMLLVFFLLGPIAFNVGDMLLEARENARRSTCLGNLKIIGMAMRLYATDFQGRLPTDASRTTFGSFALLTNRYQTSFLSWVCPSDAGVMAPRPTETWGRQRVSYAYGGFGLTEQLSPDTPLCCDRSSSNIRHAEPYFRNKWTHRSVGGNVLFADGHVTFQRTFVPPMYQGRNP